jgi:hypothetical protein
MHREWDEGKVESERLVRKCRERATVVATRLLDQMWSSDPLSLALQREERGLAGSNNVFIHANNRQCFLTSE